MSSISPVDGNNRSNELYLDFQAGVTACLRSWSALRTAVENGWGGGTRESQVKADELRQNIFNILDGKKFPPSNFDVYDLADNLAIYMEEEFSVTLEDDSERQVAETIFKMYEDCYNGNPTLARQLVSNADGVVAFNSQFPVQLQTTEHDDDDDDDDQDMVDGPLGSQPSASQPPLMAAMQQEIPIVPAIPNGYNDQPLFGIGIKKPTATSESVRQLGEAIPEEKEVEMDEDGFAPVVKSKGRRQR
jgi:pre-rRNA-processing protein TSR2